MADVFLSYSRGDRAVAERLAHAIGEAGLTVWWDRHIKGGSEFSRDIERQLEAASHVLVIWSKEAVNSRWVRDEASVAADSGRLVSATVDGTPPPLGFRQFQTIDLKDWTARGVGMPPALAEALEVETPAAAHRKSAPAPRRRLVAAGLAALLLVCAAIGTWFFLGKRAEASEPVLAVLPFSDLSPNRDKAYFAEGVAEAILTVLAKEQGIRVLGRSTAEQLHNARGNAEQMRRALGVTHVLEGSARSAGDQLRMSVRLINASDGRQLWAEEYQRRLDNVFAVQDEIGRAVAQRLKGSFAPVRPATQQLTAADTYTLYLAARAKMRDRRMSSLQDAFKLARQVIATDPKYAPGHALYAELAWHMSDQHYGKIPHSRARQVAEQHARRAIQLAPEAAEGHAALGLILPPSQAVHSLTKAIRLDPARAEVRHWLGMTLSELGRNEEALEHARAVVELEPLWGNAVSRYAMFLVASDRHSEAEQVADKFEERGGSPAVAARVRSEIAVYRGDLSEALRFLRLSIARDPEVPFAARRLGSLYALVGLPAQAAAASRNSPLYMRLFRAYEQQRLVEEVRRAGGKVWDQPDANIAVAALAIGRDWALIEALYDAFPGGVRAMCEEHADSPIALNVAMALRYRGRALESKQMLECRKQWLRIQSRSRVRSPNFPSWDLDMSLAQVHAVEGRRDRAVPLLESAIRRGYRTRYGRGLSDLPAFDPFKADPRYARLDALLKQLIASERADVLKGAESKS